MLQTLHDKLKGVFATVVLGALAVVFIFWGVEFVRIGGGGAGGGLEVNGEKLDAEAVRREFQQELTRAQVAQPTGEVPADVREMIGRNVLEGAVRRALVRQRATELGFRVSDEAVMASLQKEPAFQVAGKFSKDAYYAAIKSVGLTPTGFEAEQRAALAVQQLDRGIGASSFVLPQEASRAIALRDEQREFGWVVFPRSAWLAGAVADDAAVAAWYEKNRSRFMTPESVALQYVELDLADVQAGLGADEAALRGYYEQNADRYTTLERRHARHILVTPGKDRDAARKKAQALYEQLKGGADFAALAKRESQDPGSAAQGGDLGFAEKSAYVGPFADAVFSMKPGDLRGPVETEFGFHVIRLEGIEPGHRKSFDEVRAEIAAEYTRAEAEKIFGDHQEELDTRSFEAAGNLQQVADALKLPVRVVPVFTRQGGDPLGKDAKLVAAVFQESALAGQTIPVVELAPGRVVAVRVTAHEKPRQQPLDAVRAQVVEFVKQEAAAGAAATAADQALTALQGGAAWPPVAANVQSDHAAPRAWTRRSQDVPGGVAAAVFRAPRPAAKPSYGKVGLPGGDLALWTLVRVAPLPVPDDAAIAARANDARLKLAQLDAGLYLAALRAGAEVEAPPQLFQ